LRDSVTNPLCATCHDGDLILHIQLIHSFL
jgi:hypothetical protein